MNVSMQDMQVQEKAFAQPRAVWQHGFAVDGARLILTVTDRPTT
jgi:hypothetical protein